MAQVAEKLSILKMTKEERASYSYYQKQLHTDRDELIAAEVRGKEQGLKEGEAKGKAEGIEEGKLEEKMAIAKNLLAGNVDISIISTATGLSEQDIEQLRSRKL